MAVEIERPEGSDYHPHQVVEEQYIEVSAHGDFELTQVIVENVDNGEYMLLFVHPTNLNQDPWPSDFIKAGATAEEFKTAIKGWFSSQNHLNCDITVTLERFDADGNNPDASEVYPVKAATPVQKHIYTIETLRLLTTKSASSVMISKQGTEADINYVAADDESNTVVRLSDSPLSGKFELECEDEKGRKSLSHAWNTNVATAVMQDWLWRSCFGIRDKV
jgi:hypothetical protein